MENFDSQSYRNELAKSLKEKRELGSDGQELAKEQLDLEKGTVEYERAKALHGVDRDYKETELESEQKKLEKAREKISNKQDKLEKADNLDKYKPLVEEIRQTFLANVENQKGLGSWEKLMQRIVLVDFPKELADKEMLEIAKYVIDTYGGEYDMLNSELWNKMFRQHLGRNLPEEYENVNDGEGMYWNFGTIANTPVSKYSDGTPVVAVLHAERLDGSWTANGIGVNNKIPGTYKYYSPNKIVFLKKA